ncbi:MAG TPA: DUF433 domain-containing protein [Terriglobales bacterium]|nr:DUF433 domain-containing protein [Terriglobales bacterium]
MSTAGIQVDPEILGGVPCFSGTRVPVQNLFDFLERGSSIEDFLSAFPTVKREHVIDVLHEAAHAIGERKH